MYRPYLCPCDPYYMSMGMSRAGSFCRRAIVRELCNLRKERIRDLNLYNYEMTVGRSSRSKRSTIDYTLCRKLIRTTREGNMVGF